jgi:hypothetical protein
MGGHAVLSLQDAFITHPPLSLVRMKNANDGLFIAGEREEEARARGRLQWITKQRKRVKKQSAARKRKNEHVLGEAFCTLQNKLDRCDR